MAIEKILAFIIMVLYLSGCGEATAVINCDKPTKIDIVTGITIGGNLSVKEVKGAIDITIGEGLKADFVSADPNNWLSIASTYQYQICQFLNSSSCSDLSKSQCLDMKFRIFNQAFDKINTELKAAQEKLILSNKKVSECVNKRTDGILVRTFSHPGNVRCPGGGCVLKSGSCNKRETTVQYVAPANYHISSYRLNQGGSNDGTTGPITAERDSSGRVVKISAYIACDPADFPGADGGWNNITLVGELSYANIDALITEARSLCENEVRM
ncbi:MAG: hypothetical protein IPL51_02855 [Candidatus Competibacteraceae bacterium]|nr:hypothetical protein [Candidatus Competibacteraceae bacterium]